MLYQGDCWYGLPEVRRRVREAGLYCLWKFHLNVEEEIKEEKHVIDFQWIGVMLGDLDMNHLVRGVAVVVVAVRTLMVQHMIEYVGSNPFLVMERLVAYYWEDWPNS